MCPASSSGLGTRTGLHDPGTAAGPKHRQLDQTTTKGREVVNRGLSESALYNEPSSYVHFLRASRPEFDMVHNFVVTVKLASEQPF